MFDKPARFWKCGSLEDYVASLGEMSEDELRCGLLQWLGGDAADLMCNRQKTVGHGLTGGLLRLPFVIGSLYFLLSKQNGSMI